MILIPRLVGPYEKVVGAPAWWPIPDMTGVHERDFWKWRCSFRCDCGEQWDLGLMGQNHRIGADGTLSPSLVCPGACGWHVFAQLVDWPYGPSPS